MAIHTLFSYGRRLKIQGVASSSGSRMPWGPCLSSSAQGPLSSFLLRSSQGHRGLPMSLRCRAGGRRDLWCLEGKRQRTRQELELDI